MGNTFHSHFANLFGEKEIKILLVGLAAVGKRTILNELGAGELVKSGVEKVEYKNIHLAVFDVGSDKDKSKPLRDHLFRNTDALVFVVDSTDRERIDEAREEMMHMLGEEDLQDAVLLVLCNKQDLPDAMNTAEVTDKLGLPNLSNRRLYIEATVATNGDGVYKGFEWLSVVLQEKM